LFEFIFRFELSAYESKSVFTAEKLEPLIFILCIVVNILNRNFAMLMIPGLKLDAGCQKGLHPRGLVVLGDVVSGCTAAACCHCS